MRIIPTLLVATVGSLGFAGAVAAKSLPTHTMTLQLPDGVVEQIHYRGDVPPLVSILPDAGTLMSFTPGLWAVDPAASFAQLDQVASQIERDALTTLREASSIEVPTIPGPAQLIRMASRQLPPGTKSFSFVETVSPSGVCTHSMEITHAGPDAKPQVVTHSSGDCSPQPTFSGPSARPGTIPPVEQSGVLQIKADSAMPTADFLR